MIASLDILDATFVGAADNGSMDEDISKVLKGISVESGSDLEKVLRVYKCTTQLSSVQKLKDLLPVFRSRMGALLFLISALLSRGLHNVHEDRDETSRSLVTGPFGHTSQEIVNLLLSGSAVANVFDGEKKDLSGGMILKGISTTVEVGFLTESVGLYKVGQYLKCPKWPIWVVSSESHYTVLFSPDTKVQDKNELEEQIPRIRRAFNAHDQSGGGEFISVEGFRQVVKEMSIGFPCEKVEQLSGSVPTLWSDFCQSLLDLDKGKKDFDLYHFNGIAKSIGNGRVSVPMRTPEDIRADVLVGPGSDMHDLSIIDNSIRLYKTQPVVPPVAAVAQHALVDCIRSRWEGAVCNWEGDAGRGCA